MNNQSYGSAPLNPQDLLNQAAGRDQVASLQASEQLLKEQSERLLQAVRQYTVSPHDLTMDHVRNAKQLPRKMREDIANLQNTIRNIITITAQTIENRNYRRWEDAISKTFLARLQQEQANRLIAADKLVSISCRSLYLAVTQFLELNKDILNRLDEAQRAQDAMRVRELVLANAVLVYELCDFVINYIEDFQVGGINELNSLRKEIETARQNFRKREEERKKEAQAPGVSVAQRNETLEHIRLREEALQKMEKEWDSYWAEIEAVGKSSQGFASRLPDLRLLRSNAEAQLDFITLMQLHAFVRTNLQSLNLASTDIVNNLQLARMTPERVQILLGNPGIM